MKLTKVPARDFDLATTLDSGQVFHWEKADGGFVGTIGDRAVFVEQSDESLKVSDGEPPSPAREPRALPGIVAHYFSLDHPLAEIYDSFPNDPVMNAARGFCRGLRIIRQPKWECLATFICSSMKQVAHIRQISLALRKRFGEPRRAGNRVVYTFPSAQRIAGASESALRQCALGYRAKNLHASAQLVTSGEVDLEAWSALGDAELRKQLCALPGVGPKIANCVMLFAYERLRAFPIDVWIERVLRRQYLPRRTKMTAQRLREFSESYFGPHGGYAQQYLFHHARMASRRQPVTGRDAALRRPDREASLAKSRSPAEQERSEKFVIARARSPAREPRALPGSLPPKLSSLAA
jgi:N-glycosylase/DNA lyase